MNRPYALVAHVSFYVHEIANTGELGKTVPVEKLRENGVQNEIKYLGVGQLEDMSKKIREFLDDIQ